VQISGSKVPVSIPFQRLSFSQCLNQHAKDEFVAGSVEEKTRGLSFQEALRLAKPETDRATSPDRINPASDALLINLVDKMPVDLARMTWSAVQRWVHAGDGAPEAIRSGERFQIGEQAPIQLEPLWQTLQAAMKEFPQFPPHVGPEHEWSPQSKKGFGLSFPTRAAMALQGERPLPSPIFGSKLVSALGLGATSLALPTGKEKELKTWLLAKEDRSVELDQLFGETYRLHEGDLYGALLCAENVLSEGVYTPDRQNREVTKKLSYLRSDSAPGGDNFGAWYHLMGSALYSMVRPEWKANLIMKIENAGSYILEGADRQEDHLNELGLQLGRRLKEVAKTGLDPEAKKAPYVNVQEFGWNRTSVRSWTVSS
jgi:hypothetical protein